ncbi:M15 family metallopeptidase [Leptothermofonsia sp. ETS-13]|uniref:M15 family metallopeptidase n=1 Tax=Leptothermofonsia sp. ETS-13 TaxID=3035696 RepID=UPI003BA0FF70
MRPYQLITIRECNEPLLPIPPEIFPFVLPHPYEKLGAPYGERSPFYLREGVLKCLLTAQEMLQEKRPGWRIQIFDAYRPIAVQQFMVDYTFRELVQAQGLFLETLTEEQRQGILEQVYEFWAVPSPDPATPPPHSTGSAIDVTLVDETGQPVPMGSPIDEMSPRSFPDHFANSEVPDEQQFHQNRQLLSKIMVMAGFEQHPQEWWHFCLGDQMWAWLVNQKNPDMAAIACYGAVA